MNRKICKRSRTVNAVHELRVDCSDSAALLAAAASRIVLIDSVAAATNGFHLLLSPRSIDTVTSASAKTNRCPLPSSTYLRDLHHRLQ